MLTLERAWGERSLAGHRLSFGLVLAVAALSLAACGRKGALELPPGPATEPPVAAAPVSPSAFMPGYGAPGAPMTQQQEDAAAVKNGFDSHGNPVATPSAKKSFILDPILQ
jgi:predicted small lipoprotein YifL